MTKYMPLQAYLEESNEQEIPLSFAEIGEIIGDDLPASAYKHRVWWSNNPLNNVMTRAWLNAGYRTAKVDMAGEKLIFRKDREPAIASRPQSSGKLFGALKGFFTFRQ